MTNVTHVDQFPPPEIKSVTKYQVANAVITAMSGKRKRRPSSTQAARTSSVNDSRATEKPSKGWAKELRCSQPNQTQSAYTNTAHAMTEENANTPAAIQRRRSLYPVAMVYRIPRIRSAQSTSAPPVYERPR